jgi:hypothetical protein
LDVTPEDHLEIQVLENTVQNSLQQGTNRIQSLFNDGHAPIEEWHAHQLDGGALSTPLN